MDQVHFLCWFAGSVDLGSMKAKKQSADPLFAGMPDSVVQIRDIHKRLKRDRDRRQFLNVMQGKEPNAR